MVIITVTRVTSRGARFLNGQLAKFFKCRNSNLRINHEFNTIPLGPRGNPSHRDIQIERLTSSTNEHSDVTAVRFLENPATGRSGECTRIALVIENVI